MGRRNSTAVESVIKGLRARGRLEDVDAGWLAAARTSAAALDAIDLSVDPEHIASLLRAHLRALERLSGVGGGHDDALDVLLAKLSSPAGGAGGVAPS